MDDIMDKKKEIEEMARVIAASRNACVGKDCANCILGNGCLYQEIARALYTEGYRKQVEIEKEILDLVPEKMIAETVRFDSAYGVSQVLGVSIEEAEELKAKYNKLKKLRDKE